MDPDATEDTVRSVPVEVRLLFCDLKLFGSTCGGKFKMQQDLF